MLKLSALKVLICGCGAGGLEIAKNLALAGVHTLSIFDPDAPAVRDLGRNFSLFVDETASHHATAGSTHHHHHDHPHHHHHHAAQGGGSNNIADGSSPIVKSRGVSAAALIADLNPGTRVRNVEQLTDDVIRHHNAVVVTSACPGLGYDLAKLRHVNDVARSHHPTPISFFYVLSAGALGSVFVDHGLGFVTTDPDGRPPLQKSIVEIVDKEDKQGRSYSRVRFATPEGMAPGSLRDQTEVYFSEVKGLTLSTATETGSINAKTQGFEAFCALNDPPNTIRIYPSFTAQGYSPYVGGGFLHEKKERVVRDFRSLESCLAEPPALILTDSMYDGTAESFVHLALSTFLNLGQTPTIADQDRAVAIAQQIVEHGRRTIAAREEAAKAITDAATTAAGPIATPGGPTAGGDSELPSRLPPPPAPTPFVLDPIDTDALRLATRLANAELQPLSTVLGAIVAQEVVKIAGKYTPIYQFLHLNISGVLPEGRASVVATEGTPYAPQGSRYDDLIELFGKPFVEKLHNLRVFLVGSGALGCEDLKNFALCGVSTGPNGQLIVTDNDRVEISNLSRQFLFREDNVGRPKSVAAAARAKTINPDMKIDARQDFVGKTTEHIFDETFWTSLDVVCNALDNIPARLFVDEKCVFYEKVLVEAGTMGTGGNVDIVVPHKTTSYADGGAADETGGIPMCTLRNFPYIYDHCIEWARALFADLFVAPIAQTAQLREDPNGFVHRLTAELAGKASAGERRSFLSKQLKALGDLEKVVGLLTREVTLHDCVLLAWSVFHTQFRDRIVSLVTSFPADARKRNGEPFWSGHRKFPTVISTGGDRTFHKDANITAFLVSAANVYAYMLGVHPEKGPAHHNDPDHPWMEQYRGPAFLASELANEPEPPVQVGGVDDLDEESAGSATAAAAAEQTDEELEAAFKAKLAGLQASASRLSTKARVVEFEKDDDDNFHIDFVAAASNLRALNYNIPTSDRMKVKLVAGRIIPAIATTTAAVTGFALIELFKVLQGKPVSTLRNGMIDVGSVNYIMFERDTPKKISTKTTSTYDPVTDYTDTKTIVAWPNPHTKYDKIFVQVTSATTVAEFADELVRSTAELPEGPYEVSSIGTGTALLWNGMPGHKNSKVPLLELIAKTLAPEGTPDAFWAKRRTFADLSVNLDTSDGNEVQPASIVLRF